jgi:hypothetical protein
MKKKNSRYMPLLIFAIPLITLTLASAVNPIEIEVVNASSPRPSLQHTSGGVDAAPSVTPSLSASHEAFYISHLSSGEYLEYAKGMVKPKREFDVLYDRLLAPLILEFTDDESFEDDVGPRLSTDSAAARDSMSHDVSPVSSSSPAVFESDGNITTNSPAVVPDATTRVVQVTKQPVVRIPSPRPRGPVRFDIPEGDYILTIGPRIREIILALKSIQGSNWIEFSRSMKAAVLPVNYSLFLLHMDVSRESECATQDCIGAREIIAQIHFRMVRLFASGVEGSLADVSSEIAILKEALKGLWIGTMWMSEVFGGRCCRTFDQYAQNDVGQVPPVMDCLSFCSFRRTTTTSTTTLSPTPSPAELERRSRLGAFLADTSSDLDNLLYEIGVVISSVSGLAPAMQSLRVKVVTKFLEIDRGIEAYSPAGYTLTTPRSIILKINGLCSRLVNVTDWSELRDELVHNIAAFRKELYRLRVANV